MTQRPNQGIRSSAKSAVVASLGGFLIFGLLGGLLGGLSSGLSSGLSRGQLVGLLFGLLGGLLGNADVVLKHYLLRLVLWLQGHTPRNYVRFLDHCASLIFLRKVGGGYIFIHRTLMEHFAAMSESDIERIASLISQAK